MISDADSLGKTRGSKKARQADNAPVSKEQPGTPPGQEEYLDKKFL